MERLRGWINQATGLAARGIARFEALPRPAQLLLTVATVIGLSLAIDAVNGWRVWNQLFHPDISTIADVRFWSALVYSLAFGLGLPVAFLLWHWRDRNVRDQIEEQRKAVENSRKDITLKEFQEVQARAAGLFDEKTMPESARLQLQIASLHQLRGFLRGEYGESFRRPAFELILAGHAEAMSWIGVRTALQQISNSHPILSSNEVEDRQQELRSQLDPIMRDRLGIIRDESNSIFASGYSLDGRIIDFTDLAFKMLAHQFTAPRASLAFAKLTGSDLQGANLNDANLIGASLREANLLDAELIGATLDGADLGHANLTSAHLASSSLRAAWLHGAILNGANLCRANLEGAKLSFAHLEGADLSDTNLEGADLFGACFDDRTTLIAIWENPTADDIETAQDKLRALGARHVNDPEDIDPNDDVPF